VEGVQRPRDISLDGLQEVIADDELERNVGKHKQLKAVDLSEFIRESPWSLHMANRVEFFPIDHTEYVMLACSMRSVIKTGLLQGKSETVLRSASVSDLALNCFPSKKPCRAGITSSRLCSLSLIWPSCGSLIRASRFDEDDLTQIQYNVSFSWTLRMVCYS